MLLDRVLPTYDVHEVHAIWIRAAPSEIFAAIRRLTPAEVPLFRLLLALRALPRRLLGRPALRLEGAPPILEQMVLAGFVVLAKEADQELVVGTVARFWEIIGPQQPLAAALPHVRNAEEYRAFDNPDYAKAATNFFLAGHDGDRCRLVTETRVLALGPVARRSFRRYWRVIYPGSALIRRMWLNAIKRRAEGSRGALPVPDAR